MVRTIKKLTAMDASYLYMETPEVPMHVGSMAIFQLPEKYRGDFFEDMKSMIDGRLHLAPMLTWKLAHTPLDIDRPSWIEDEQFDIDRHIFRGALPAPADFPTLQRLVGWMHAKLLNRARPALGNLCFRQPARQSGRDLLQDAPRLHRRGRRRRDGTTSV